MLTKHVAKKFDGDCTRMLWAKSNKSKKQHPIKQQLYSHLPPISKTIQIRQTRHVRHCWRSKDELISEVLQRTTLHGCKSVGRPAWNYLQQLCTDTRCSLEDLLEVIDDKDGWQERVREICANSMTWWWWYYIICFTIFFSWKMGFIVCLVWITNSQVKQNPLYA